MRRRGLTQFVRQALQNARRYYPPQNTANGSRCFVLMKSEPESQNSNVEAWKTNGSKPIKGWRTFCPFFFVAL